MFKFFPKSTHTETPEPETMAAGAWLSRHGLRGKNWLLIGVALGSVTGLGLNIWAWRSFQTMETGPMAEVLTYARQGTVTITASDGTVLQQIGPVVSDPLTYQALPPQLVKAFIASEDRRFYDHHGIDPQGVMRAIFSNLRARNTVEGGSTITQQLARIIFLNQERSLQRKVKEARTALEIEHNYPKDKILERYLNLVYLGSGAYGIADAAWIYFSKTVDQLTLPEMAMIAGLAPAPSRYSPFVDMTAAKKRRDLVLTRMAEDGAITQEEAAAAIATPVETYRSLPKRFARQYPYFTDYVQQELEQKIPAEVLQQGGLTVETTLKPEWQKIAENKLTRAIERDGRWGSFSQGALTTIDPRTGAILVMVGGKDFTDTQYNRVTQAKRQPGSTFKTFVYTTAIASGMSPYRSFLDAPYTVDGYSPRNFGDKYRNANVSLKDALTNSINVVAVRTLVEVGWDPIIATAKKMGITSALKGNYSLALGSSEVTLLELASAYGTLANQGLHLPVHSIVKVRDRNGKVIYSAPTEGIQAVDKDTAAIMDWMLQGVVNSGTGRAASLDRPVAGKTGTSDKARDLWFVGYVPQLVTGVWLGNDDNKPTNSASSTAAEIWGQVMAQITKELPVEKFPSLPQLEGRKGTVKTKPMKPKASSYKKIKSAPLETTPDRREPSPGRSRTNSTPRPETPTKPTQNTPKPQPAPKPQIVPVKTPSQPPSQPIAPPVDAPPAPPATRRDPEPPPQSLPIPVTPPPSSEAPPAPPAAKRGEDNGGN